MGIQTMTTMAKLIMGIRATTVILMMGIQKITGIVAEEEHQSTGAL